MTDPRGSTALGPGDVVQVLWLDRCFGQTVGRLENARAKCAKEAEEQGVLKIRRVRNVWEASEILQLARHGVKTIDAVVTELHVGNDPQGGLGLLQLLDSLWDGEVNSRPLYCLLTPQHDRSVIAIVKNHLRTCMVRHDRPYDIVKALSAGEFCAAVLPDTICHTNEEATPMDVDLTEIPDGQPGHSGSGYPGA